MRKPLIALLITLGLAPVLVAQDFLLQGCYWSCPEDSPGTLPDSATLAFWVEHLTEQSPEFAHAGFTGIWLPNLTAQAPQQVKRLIESLKEQGLIVIAEIDLQQDSMGSLTQQGIALKDALGVESFSITDRPLYPADAFVADYKGLVNQGASPDFIIRGLPDFDQSGLQIDWIRMTLKSLEGQSGTKPRIYDYQLREALRSVSADSTLDAR
ncbi:MAG: hypothetical protein KI786_08820, partial [Mameliella sp.]|nr:hypothetical protein [Phaeodactylibacter sp.]